MFENLTKKIKGMFGEKSHTQLERGNPSGGGEIRRQERKTETIQMTSEFDQKSGLPVLVERPQTQTETQLQRINPNEKAIATGTSAVPAIRGPHALQEQRQVVYARPIPGHQRQIDGKRQKLIGPGEALVKRENTLPEKPKAEEQFEKKNHKVVIADITAIVDRYARTLAEQKVHERIENSGFLKKSWVRLSEAGYVEKYYQEAKAEILKNRNLLSDIQTRLMHKSEGKAARAGAEDAHSEILDKVIESFVDTDLLDKKTRGQEVKAERVDLGAAENSRLDSEAASLITDYALGNITDQKTFDAAVEKRLVPILGKAGAKQGEDRMYASGLFEMAKGYKHQLQEKLDCVGKEFGPEQKAYVEKFIKGTLHLDVKLGEKTADLYQKRPEGVMKWYEKSVDWLQKGAILSPDSAVGSWMSKFTGKDNQGKIARVAGKILANPVLYAAIGNVAGRAGAKALGAGVGSAFAIGAGVAFMPATLAIVGSGIAAGMYLGARAAREKRRDIARREQEVVMGLRDKESHDVVQAEKLIDELQKLQTEDKLLSDEEKKRVGEIQARLDVQSWYEVDLIGVSKEAGDKYGGKFVVEQNLRKALKDFWLVKGKQYGNTPAEQNKAYAKFQSEAKGLLVTEIEKVDDEKAEAIRKYRNNVALKGAVVSMAAAALGPLVAKGLKMGSNFALGTHFNADKITYPEQVANWYKEKFLAMPHEGVYAGALSTMGIPGANVNLNLPPGFGWANHVVDSHGNHVVDLVDSHGNLIPEGHNIPFDSAGNVADPHALDSLKGAGWNIHETHGALGHGSGAYTEAELRADGFDKNPRADWHHIKDFDTAIKQVFNGKELQAYKQVLGSGDEQWDVQKMLNNLKDNADMVGARGHIFGTDMSGNVDAQLQELQDQIVVWNDAGGKAEIAKHLVMRVIASEQDNKVTGLSKIIGSFDADGHLNLAAKYGGAAYKEIGIMDDSGNFHALATDPTGSGMLKELATGGKFGAVDMRPPLENAAPFIYAGSRRETDKDVEEQRKKEKEEAEEKKKAEHDKEGHGKHGGHEGGHGPEENESPEKRMEHAFGEIKDKLDKGKVLTTKELAATAEKHKVEPLDLVTKALEYKKIEYKEHEAGVIKSATERGVDMGPFQARALILIESQTHDFEEAEKLKVFPDNESEPDDADSVDLEETEQNRTSNKKTKEDSQKETKGKKAEKQKGEKTKDKDEDKEKKKPELKGKVKDINETKAEKRVKMNGELLKHFSRDYGIQGVKLNLSESFKDRFNGRSVEDNSAFLDNLATALRRVRAALKEKMPNNLNLSIGGEKLAPHPDKQNIEMIPFDETPDNISKYLTQKLRNKRGGNERPRQEKKTA